jgi:hypothetical protein
MKSTTRRLLPILAVSAGLVLSSPSEAYLVDRGHGLVYDTVLDVTWLLDANYAKTSGYHPTGLMTWEEANAWAGSLSYGGHGNWRLPTLTPVNGVAFQYDFAIDGSTDWGYNITSPNSELAYMYHVNLLNRGLYTAAGDAQMGWDETPRTTVRDGVTNALITFLNIDAEAFWTNLAYAPDDIDFAWAFGFDFGVQSDLFKSGGYLAWAVHDGDVQFVPVPAAAWLLGSALIALGGVHRRGART